MTDGFVSQDELDAELAMELDTAKIDQEDVDTIKAS